MNIDELKTQWQELRLRVDKLEDNNARLAHQLAAGKAVNYKQQTCKNISERHYRKLCLAHIGASRGYSA